MNPGLTGVVEMLLVAVKSQVCFLQLTAQQSLVEAVITCPWLENSSEKFPVLMLPESSSDLLFESELLFPAAEVSYACLVRSVESF